MGVGSVPFGGGASAGGSVSSIGSIVLIALIALAVIGGIAALIIALANKKEQDYSTEDRSYFDGGYLAYLAYSFLVGFVSVITLGIAFPWMCCLMQRWKARHTIVNGKRMVFDGTGVQLIGRFILWMFLSLITFGIYSIWMTLAIKKWITKHTHFMGEEDQNSYFDGGFWGYVGISILSGLVTLVPVVGFVWSGLIMTRWMVEHTVVDSRRLVFTGKLGTFFLKNLLWGFLTIITFGIFGLFVPVKQMRLEAENTIDHEHTPEALMKQSEYRNMIRTESASFKSYRVEDEMEGIKAGITDAMEQNALLEMAKAGLRSAKYTYAARYGAEQYTEEPFSTMLLEAAEAEYAPAMCLYAQTHNGEKNGDFFTKAAQRGQIPAIRNRLIFCGNCGFSVANAKDSLPWLKEAVRFGDLLIEGGEELSEEEQGLLKKCVLEIRRIESGTIKKSSGAGKVVAIVIAAMAALLLILGLLSMLFLRAETAMKAPMGDDYGYSSDMVSGAPAQQSASLGW